MNRGSELQDSRASLQRTTSMRPRFMNRGSIVDALAPEAESHDFNEAPIHESGKCDSTSRQDRIMYHFNEAPIHESGKSCCVAVASIGYTVLQ